MRHVGSLWAKADIRNDYDRSDKHRSARQDDPDFGELARLRIDLD
jgi:hypothetical protein